MVKQKNDVCKCSKIRLINMKEIDQSIKNTKEKGAKIEKEMWDLHKKISLLL